MIWHKLGHWPIVRLSFIGNGSDRSHGANRSHESTGQDTERESQVKHGDLDHGVRVHMLLTQI